MKAKHAREVKKFLDIPNVGKAMERDFVLLGIVQPKDLMGRDAYEMYKELYKRTGIRPDPCVLDTYLAVIDFMHGKPPRMWYWYTQERKKNYPKV